jgi:uncharacterized protein (TIGR03437 family)
MTRINSTILLLGSALLMAAAPARVQAQSFDTSGTGSLSGPYLFRYVNFFNDESGNLTESCTISGTITFDGFGHYTLSNTQVFDSGAVKGVPFCNSLGGGTYGVQSNGIAQLDNPLLQATLFGTFSQPVLTASSTEDDGFDLFIALKAPASANNGILAGPFTVGTLDFPGSDATKARQGYFNLNADGHGNISAFTVTGSLANVKSGATVTQNIAASTYAFTGASSGTMTFPGSSTSESEIVGGEKLLYVSNDGNWIVGGSATGSDMIFGFRAPSGTSSNALLSGTYFTAGLEDAAPGSENFLDAFYGSISANGAGALITHERFDDVVDVATYDNTFNAPVTIGSDGSFYDGNVYTYLAGANGKALMLIGSNQQFSLIVGVHAPAYTPTPTLWLDPVGITEAANYTPITNSFSPGELVNLYGTFGGVSGQAATTLPIPITIGGVQVLVNGQPAPIDFVSETQISTLIPYEIVGDSFVTFQVVIGGSKSNPVTVYAGNTAPGIYTLTENGIGAGAILHANFTAVTTSSPAQPGETVVMFMSGLGPVTPGVGDGAAAPASPVSQSVESVDIGIFLGDPSNGFLEANVSFAGLAPFFAGLYQVNFSVPQDGLTNGDNTIAFETIEGLNEMATISLSGFSNTSGLFATGTHAPLLRSHAVAARAASGRHVRSFRRALPDR